eukprot:4189449-Pyramimonas_sp.AAC.1
MTKGPGAFASPPTPAFACTFGIFMPPVGGSAMLKMVPLRFLYDFANTLPFGESSLDFFMTMLAVSGTSTISSALNAHAVVIDRYLTGDVTPV